MLQPLNENMRKIYSVCAKIAKSDISVLLVGETGTGKEYIARYIHSLSGRAGKFVALNCSALQDTLIESELFGYKKGSFTGADKDKIGLIKAADNGTLFLDEVADMSLSMQSKLLRVLETGDYYPIGGTDVEKSNFRLISATNKEIKDLIKKGHFRLDLYERISSAVFYIAPLRDRIEEIPYFADYFVKQISGKDLMISPEVIERFLCYDWPGNLRELRETIRFAVAMLDENEIVIQVKHLPAKFNFEYHLNERQGLRQMVENFKGIVIRRTYELYGENYKKVMEKLGISKDTVYRYIRKFKNRIK